MSEWWSMENGRAHFSIFLLLLARVQLAASSTVSNLNFKKPADGRLAALITEDRSSQARCLSLITQRR